LPQRQPGSLRLPVEQILAKPMNCHPTKLLVDRCEQTAHLELARLPQPIERPRRIFASAPAQKDLLHPFIKPRAAVGLRWYFQGKSHARPRLSRSQADL